MTSTWIITPRDPIVSGDGGAVPALPIIAPNPLPPQATVAGFVRTALLSATANVSRGDASAVLDTTIRGPLLATFDVDTPGVPNVWVPAPRDAVAFKDNVKPATLLRVGQGEGVWPALPGGLSHLVDLPSKVDGEKGRSPVRPPEWRGDAPALWPLEVAVSWALSGASPKLDGLKPPVKSEPRVHVAIERRTGTAQRAALFSSLGWRYDDTQRASLLVEVDDPRGRTPARRGTLGGESRPAMVETRNPSILPKFERDRYAAALDERKGGPVVLRIHLLTPGCFDGALPELPAEIGATLIAACVPGFSGVSGWNLQARGPRRVRRLVPAGSVYYFAAPREHVLDICESLWLRPLVTGVANETEHLAAPGHDGHGLCLPGFLPLPEVSLGG